MKKFTIEKDSSKINILGELTRHSIDNKNQQCIEPYLENDDIIVDLSSVTKIDTAGLAWLLLLVEKANAKHVKLYFSHLNDELVKLAKLSGVEEFLPTCS